MPLLLAAVRVIVRCRPGQFQIGDLEQAPPSGRERRSQFDTVDLAL